jgi:predicted nucleic acid-binding protein
MILVDSNVIIDVLTKDPILREWSEAALADAADREEVAINPIIYAGFTTMAYLDRHLWRRCVSPARFALRGGGLRRCLAFVEYR